MTIQFVIMLAGIAVIVAIIVNQIYPFVASTISEGFQTQTPMERAKKLLSYMDFEGVGDEMMLKITTPGGLRVEQGGVTVTNTNDDTTFADKAGGLLLNQTKLTTPPMELPKRQTSAGTTWAIAPDSNGVVSASVTYWNPVVKDGGYVPILGFMRNEKDGTYVRGT